MSKKQSNRFLISLRKEDEFEEQFVSTFSRFEMISIAIVIALLLFSIAFALFRYTPLKRFVVQEKKNQRELIQLHQQMDSLEIELQNHNQYSFIIQELLNGNTIRSVDSTQTIDLGAAQAELDKGMTEREQELIDKVKDQSAYVLQGNSSDRVHFTAPLSGLVSSDFDAKNHYGIDIVAPQNTPILAVADGTVISSSWSNDNGYMLVIQHKNEFISVYKHNSRNLKEVGQNVRAGEAIAIIGNSGENTTGYHLHVELWQNGRVLNPKEYLPI